MVEHAWQRIEGRFEHTALDAYVVMPNHLHGIITLSSLEHGRERYRELQPQTRSGRRRETTR